MHTVLASHPNTPRLPTALFLNNGTHTTAFVLRGEMACDAGIW